MLTQLRIVTDLMEIVMTIVHNYVRIVTDLMEIVMIIVNTTKNSD